MTAILNLAAVARDAMPDGGKLILESRAAAASESGAASGTSTAGISTADHVTIVVSISTCRTSAHHPQPAFADLGMAADLSDADQWHYQGVSRSRPGNVCRNSPRAVGFVRLPAQLSGKAEIVGGDQAVLIVEDDVMVRRYVISQVQSLGYRTLSAGDPSEALAIIDANEESISCLPT
jgi:CheY-like chemotaxis protein